MARIALTLARSSLGGSIDGAEQGPDALLNFRSATETPIVDALRSNGHTVKVSGDLWLPEPNVVGNLIAGAKRAVRNLWPGAKPKQPPQYAYEPTATGDAKNLEKVMQYVDEIQDVTLSRLMRGYKPLTIGGDHSITMGVISALALYYRTQTSFGGWIKSELGWNDRNTTNTAKGPHAIGAIWVDAHGDYNNPKISPSGNVHGMPLASVSGAGNLSILRHYRFPELDPSIRHDFGATEEQAMRKATGLAAVDPKNIVIIGARDLDEKEEGHLRAKGVNIFTAEQVRTIGMHEIMKQAIELATQRGGRNTLPVKGFHLSFDMDSIDPQFAPGVSTAVKGGLSIQDAKTVMQVARDSGRVLGLDIVELNPKREAEDKRTTRLARELILEACGTDARGLSRREESMWNARSVGMHSGL